VTDADGLFSQHQRGVYRYLWRLVGQADAAEDLTQEVFLRVARTSPPETTETGCRAWIFRIARNLGLNYIRDRKRRPEEELAVAQVAPATQELSVALDRALSNLSDLDRDIFLLRETGGLSYAEVADACELTADAVRLRLHRARLTLREALAPTLVSRRSSGVRLE
jgi:RNA polymerase sigma-70 factor (ECF subfamily)